MSWLVCVLLNRVRFQTKSYCGCCYTFNLYRVLFLVRTQPSKNLDDIMRTHAVRIIFTQFFAHQLSSDYFILLLILRSYQFVKKILHFFGNNFFLNIFHIILTNWNLIQLKMKCKHRELIYFEDFLQWKWLCCNIYFTKWSACSVISQIVIFQKMEIIISPILTLTYDVSMTLCDNTIPQNWKKMNFRRRSILELNHHFITYAQKWARKSLTVTSVPFAAD